MSNRARKARRRATRRWMRRETSRHAFLNWRRARTGHALTRAIRHALRWRPRAAPPLLGDLALLAACSPSPAPEPPVGQTAAAVADTTPAPHSTSCRARPPRTLCANPD